MNEKTLLSCIFSRLNRSFRGVHCLAHVMCQNSKLVCVNVLKMVIWAWLEGLTS